MRAIATGRPGAVRLGLFLVPFLVGIAGRPASVPAHDEVAASTPTFSEPLAITNEFHPFVPGAVKVYAGPEKGVPMMTVETHLRETRGFAWNATLVTCRVVELLEFRRGVQVGSERVFLAQADDGSVWAFGEVEDDNVDNAEDKGEGNGWIVGTTASEDPPGVVAGAEPALFMPASPGAGDEWTSLNTPPDFLKRNRVRSAQDVVSVRAGRLSRCLRIQEVDVPEESSEARWYAPGLGLVRTRAPRERATLVASTIPVRR